MKSKLVYITVTQPIVPSVVDQVMNGAYEEKGRVDVEVIHLRSANRSKEYNDISGSSQQRVMKLINRHRCRYDNGKIVLSWGY